MCESSTNTHAASRPPISTASRPRRHGDDIPRIWFKETACLACAWQKPCGLGCTKGCNHHIQHHMISSYWSSYEILMIPDMRSRLYEFEYSYIQRKNRIHVFCCAKQASFASHTSIHGLLMESLRQPHSDCGTAPGTHTRLASTAWTVAHKLSARHAHTDKPGPLSEISYGLSAAALTLMKERAARIFCIFIEHANLLRTHGRCRCSDIHATSSVTSPTCCNSVATPSSLLKMTS